MQWRKIDFLTNGQFNFTDDYSNNNKILEYFSYIHENQFKLEQRHNVESKINLQENLR